MSREEWQIPLAKEISVCSLSTKKKVKHSLIYAFFFADGYLKFLSTTVGSFLFSRRATSLPYAHQRSRLNWRRVLQS